MSGVSDLKQRLRTDLTAAIKGRDPLTSSTLRMALAAVQSAEMAGATPRELTDDDVQGVLGTEVKRRKEAADAFRGAGREEQAAKEESEAVILLAYLPKQLSDDDLKAVVADAIAETGATDPKAMGQVMKAVMAKVQGRADGKAVSAEVRRQLAG
jgi:uncharacterized protein YqeY